MSDQESDDFRQIIDLAESVEDISPETVFDILSNQRRRFVIEALMASDRGLPVRDLRNVVVEKEFEAELTEIPDEQVKQVLISLYHSHIPKLADENVVNYDDDRDIVTPTEKFERIQPIFSRSS